MTHQRECAEIVAGMLVNQLPALVEMEAGEAYLRLVLTLEGLLKVYDDEKVSIPSPSLN